MSDIEKMTKKQLESYAREELGIELDRRHNKQQLLSTVKKQLKDNEIESKSIEVLTPPSQEGTSLVRQYIQEQSGLRRDASIIWNTIKDDAPGVGTDDEIKQLVASKDYTELLGELENLS
jgi:Zn-dependent M32 family carboxypeptidase